MGKQPATKKCSKCQIVKSVSEFYKRSGGEPGYHYMCKDCMKAYYRDRWQNLSPEEKTIRKSRYLDWYNQIKEGIFEHYGTECECCGETQIEFLSIDHINGGGNKHRRDLGGGTSFFKWLRDENYPPGFRVLCMNCNWALGRLGYCPHNERGESS